VEKYILMLSRVGRDGKKKTAKKIPHRREWPGKGDPAKEWERPSYEQPIEFPQLKHL